MDANYTTLAKLRGGVNETESGMLLLGHPIIVTGMNLLRIPYIV